jgi:hypothetical protein
LIGGSAAVRAAANDPMLAADARERRKKPGSKGELKRRNVLT